jgi:SAM-dependent methyltransferase
MSSFRDFLFDRSRSKPYALAVAMTGVRMGERLLLVGDDALLFAQLAGKVGPMGLNGRCAVVVGSEEAAARVEAVAAAAGVPLEEVHHGVLPAVPVADGGFDVAVVDAGATFLTRLDGAKRVELARSLHRALRTNGRLVLVEGQPKTLVGLFLGRPTGLDAFRAEGGAPTLLEAAGFHPVRVLADRSGQRFTEGLKS